MNPFGHWFLLFEYMLQFDFWFWFLVRIVSDCQWVLVSGANFRLSMTYPQKFWSYTVMCVKSWQFVTWAHLCGHTRRAPGNKHWLAILYLWWVLLFSQNHKVPGGLLTKHSMQDYNPSIQCKITTLLVIWDLPHIWSISNNVGNEINVGKFFLDKLWLVGFRFCLRIEFDLLL